jgi:5-methylcytosine-specific restriction endonuclease McrA
MLADHYKVRGGYRILPNHPYIASFWANVRPVPYGWKVVWRDYTSMKQVVEFDTEGEANTYCAELVVTFADGCFVDDNDYLNARGCWDEHLGSAEAFYETPEWRKLRYEALVKYGAKCSCCGTTRADGKTIHVDHIKPRSRFPHLALTLSNLQVLCEDCNIGKGAWDHTDWRGSSQNPPERAC